MNLLLSGNLNLEVLTSKNCSGSINSEESIRSILWTSWTRQLYQLAKDASGITGICLIFWSFNDDELVDDSRILCLTGDATKVRLLHMSPMSDATVPHKYSSLLNGQDGSIWNSVENSSVSRTFKTSNDTFHKQENRWTTTAKDTYSDPTNPILL